MRVAFGAILLLVSLQASAQVAGLMDLYRAAQRNDPVFAAARATHAAGLESRAIGLSGLLPTLRGSASASAVAQDWTSGGARRRDDYLARTGAISLTQPLFDLEKFTDLDIGGMQAAQADSVFAEERQGLMLRVSQAYVDFLLAQDNLELAAAQKNALGAQSEQTRRLYESGVATVTDMEENRARFLVAEAQELVAANALEVSRKQLEKSVGTLPPGLRHSGVYAFEPVLPEPNELEVWKSSSRTQALGVLSAGIELKLAELQARKSQQRHYPVVQLSASYQHAIDPSEATQRSDVGRLGVDLLVPLYQGGRIDAETRRALQLQQKSASDLEARVRQSEIDATEAFLGVVGGLSRIRAFELAVQSSATALKGMEIGQRHGLRTNTDVLTAQQQLYAARRDLQRERYAYLMNRLKLKAAIGSLDEPDLAFIDRLVEVSMPGAVLQVLASGRRAAGSAPVRD